MSNICQSRSIVRGGGGAPETSEIFPPFHFTISLKASMPSSPGAVAWRTWPSSKKTRAFSPLRSGELEHGGRAAHALELNDVGDVQIAQRALEFLFPALRTGRNSASTSVTKSSCGNGFSRK